MDIKTMLQMQNAWKTFTQNHPKFPSFLKADYYRNTNREYSVHCQVMEKKLPLIDLTVTVPSEEEAKTISNNWHKKNQEIYAQIMAELL